MEAGEKRKITKRSTNLRNFHFMRMWIASIYISCLLFFHAFHMSILNSGEMVRISLKERSIKKEVENDYPLLTDFMKYEKREYSRYVEKSRFLHHLQDEKELSFHTFNNTFIPPTKCSTPEDVLNFFMQYKSTLYKRCIDFRKFSHCQPHYLFQFDSDYNTCHSYYHERYIERNYTGVTLTLPLSANRMDRLPLHMDRWSSDMSIAIQVDERDLSSLVSEILAIKRKNVRYSFYVVKDTDKDVPPCTFVSMNGTRVPYSSCFVINVLRNLAIETIRTTHFMIVDGDAILSGTFEKNLHSLSPLLVTERELLLFPLIPYNNPAHKACISKGDCEKAWSDLPKTKQELLRDESYIKGIRSTYLFFNLKKWKRIKENDVMPITAPRTMEPYGIIKRTRNTPLFHPYFINYGGNKEQYYCVLSTMNYNYHVMTMDFSVDLPHPPSKYIKEARKGDKAVFSQQLFAYFNLMYNTYCSRHHCQYFSNQYVNTKALKKGGYKV